MKRAKLLVVTVAAVLSSCCLDHMDVQPSVEFEHSAKAYEPKSVGVGFRFEFKDWCPDKAYKEQLKKLTKESDEDRQLYRQKKITLDEYNERQRVNKEAAINFITQAQRSAIPQENKNAPTTKVIPLLADGTAGNASETVEQKATEEEQKGSLEAATDSVKEQAKAEQ